MNEKNILTDAKSVTNAELAHKYLTFSLNNQIFAFPISQIVQMVGMQKITPIPEFPYYANGIMMYRGNAIPIIDLRRRLSMPDAEYDDKTCILIAAMSDIIDKDLVGYVVDQVEEVAEIDDDEITDPPSISDNPMENYITGVGVKNNDTILLLDSRKLTNDFTF